ncbi:hypothetical protein ABZ470_23855 [Streptosporangium sp. NPDC020072]|uniref:hypothetical protein n=1 Tax=Streptosporangium sp. NPDC020072 TaxID=3154788 RepID=UPI003424225A
MTDFGIQLSLKLKDSDTLLNIRADDHQDFEMLADWASENAEIFTRVHEAVRGVPRATDGVALIQEMMPGSTVIAEYGAPPPSHPTPTAAAAQPYCDRCKKAPVCGVCGLSSRPRKSIKDGKYWIHDCPQDTAHKGVWCNEPKG